MHVNAIQESRPSLLQNYLIKKFDKKNKISWTIILLLLLIFYLLLVLLPFPDYQQVSEIEIDDEFFEIFEPPPPILHPRQPVKEIESPGDLKMPSQAEVAAVFTFEEFEEEFDPGGDIIQEMDIFDEVGGGFEELVEMVDVTNGSSLNGYSDFLTGDDESYDFDIGLGNYDVSGENFGIKGASGSEFKLGPGGGGGRGGGVRKSVGDGKAIGPGSGVSVALRSFGEDDYHGKDIVNPLIEWMKKHPKPHPYTMEQFLEHESGDLTSIVEFTVQDRPIEIYLRCTEKTKELAICIVQGGNATKLIDQGISERSHKLEIGSVLRNEDDRRIVNVISRNISPTREKTNIFMSIFLSWWNNGDPVSGNT